MCKTFDNKMAKKQIHESLLTPWKENQLDDKYLNDLNTHMLKHTHTLGIFYYTKISIQVPFIN